MLEDMMGTGHPFENPTFAFKAVFDVAAIREHSAFQHPHKDRP
jgi:hypothetical protein